MDVKRELIKHIKYLNDTGINLRLSVFGEKIKNDCPLEILQKNGIIKLFIQIPNW
jgi:hypothetical protein